VVDSHEMAARAGIEPAVAFLQAAIEALSCENRGERCAQRDAQNAEELREVVGAWPGLSPEIRFAILALARARQGDETGNGANLASARSVVPTAHEVHNDHQPQ
jgi:hypothetical protein